MNTDRRAFNVIEEPIIRVELTSGVRERSTLPQVFAALLADRVETWPALRPHQAPAWHAFLVQIGAMGLEALIANRFGVQWRGRRYDRANPTAADLANQSINHAATAVQAAAAIAVTSLSALPQLGFIHEESDQAFVLGIADLLRDKVTLRLPSPRRRKPKRGPRRSTESCAGVQRRPSGRRR